MLETKIVNGRKVIIDPSRSNNNPPTPCTCKCKTCHDLGYYNRPGEGMSWCKHCHPEKYAQQIAENKDEEDKPDHSH